ncbi:DUF3168 domain-containing protein [Acuticoccus sp. M5D2P5]|uniref:DUF3168 domain-containing protein n=1 Tax=Acuticoccus kalidii TaxID=2910977 RepID=UPI001F41F2B9|nr:DUF3168 domain-containing protein [Acuticoccus kalidii]MCF3934459.1 DUF3168 domain-containing protein [Acuticoccus kalidii]
MSDARHALLGAIYAAITEDIGLDAILAGDKVFDAVPRGVDYPFVVFGTMTSRALDADDAATMEHRFDVFVHSRAGGRSEVSDIAERVRALLEGPLAPVGHRLVSMGHRTTEVSASRDGLAYRARLGFRALTEAI